MTDEKIYPNTEGEEIHPHEVMAEFVNKFENFIKPYLEKGDLNSVRHIIGDVVLRDLVYQEDPGFLSSKKGAYYSKYKMAIQYLSGLVRAENVDKKTLQDLVTCSGRLVADLDLILNKDPHYKLVRDEIKDYPKSL